MTKANKTIRLLSWNVNGIRAAEKKGFIDWLTKSNADVVALQETKAHPSQLSAQLLKPDHYFSYWHLGERKGYSGVGLYTKEEPRSVTTAFDNARLDAEGRTQMADFGSFVLFNVYFPNGGQGPHRLAYKMKYYDEFLKLIIKLKKQGKHVIMCGDVNTAHQAIDLARPKENEKTTGFLPEERAWIDKLIAAGFIDTFRMFNTKAGQYSYWDQKSRARDRNVGWRIDYFFVSDNMRDRVEKAFIFADIMGSDHCPIGIDIAA